MPTDLGAALAARRRNAEQANDDPLFLLLWIMIALAHVTLALADPVFAHGLVCLGRF